MKYPFSKVPELLIKTRDGNEWMPLFDAFYIKTNYSPISVGRCEEHPYEYEGDYGNAALPGLKACTACGGRAVIEVDFTPRALEAFNIYSQFYPLKYSKTERGVRIEGPCEQISDLLGEIIYDYLYYKSL